MTKRVAITSDGRVRPFALAALVLSPVPPFLGMYLGQVIGATAVSDTSP